jgi:hypothetical protein
VNDRTFATAAAAAVGLLSLGTMVLLWTAEHAPEPRLFERGPEAAARAAAPRAPALPAAYVEGEPPAAGDEARAPAAPSPEGAASAAAGGALEETDHRLRAANPSRPRERPSARATEFPAGGGRR